MNCGQCGAPLPGDSFACGQCGTLNIAPTPVSVAGPPPIPLNGDEPTHVPLRINDLLEGKWRLERKLGEGGMGSVYLAHELQLDRKVAIKLLSHALIDDQELVTRFEREGKLTAGLEHPNIVPVYAVGRHDKRPFIVMKALEGKTLSVVLRDKGALDEDELLLLVRQLAAGLDFIHSKGFIHRDIKAGNIIVASDGRATILDFGILRASRGAEQLTRTGMVMGTPQYMSPEQALGIRDIDHRSDLYALAVLTFECMTGGLPFDSDNDLSIIQMQAHSQPPDAKERAPWIPRAVADVMQRALAKSPADRYATATELCVALEQAYFVPDGDTPAARANDPNQFPMPPPSAVSRSVPAARPRSASSPGMSGIGGGRLSAAAPAAGPARESKTNFMRSPLSGGQALAPSDLLKPEHLLTSTGETESGPSTNELAASLRRTRLPLFAGGGVAMLVAIVAILALRTPGNSTRTDSGSDAVSSAAPDAGMSFHPAVAVVVADAGAAREPVVDGDLAVDAGTSLVKVADVPDGPETDHAREHHRLPKGLAPVLKTGPGKLNLVTTRKGEPMWAQVTIDGQEKGRTPVLLELTAGKHQVRLERLGFRPIEKQIKIASGRAAVLRIELVP